MKPLSEDSCLIVTDGPCSASSVSLLQEFLLNMEDSVDETEAVKRYNQYKLDFRRQQLQEFFFQHKDQEWFRSKYHPDDITTRKAESQTALKTRLAVFLFLLDNSWLDKLSLDVEHTPAIIKLLDAGEPQWDGGPLNGLWVTARALLGHVCSGDQDGGRHGPGPAGAGGARCSCTEHRWKESGRGQRRAHGLSDGG